MIVTAKYNTEESINRSQKQADYNIHQFSVYEFQDGTYCRPVSILGVTEMVASDCNGDVWFTVPSTALDVIPDAETIAKISDGAIGLNVDFIGKTIKDLHNFCYDLNNGYSEIKSGFYPKGLRTREFPTFDLEFQFYYNSFGTPDCFNMDIRSNKPIEI